MKKIISLVLILSLLILTACNSGVPTGKGITEISEVKVSECIKTCSNEGNAEEIYASCQSIQKYGG